MGNRHLIIHKPFQFLWDKHNFWLEYWNKGEGMLENEKKLMIIVP
jgi:hypothetical protein